MTTQAIEKPETAEIACTERTACGCLYRPNVDIIETDHELTILADIPGVAAGDVDVNFENGTLTIHGPLREKEREGADFSLQEYGVGDFHRTFQVSETLDAARMAAEYADGILTLHLPKVEAVKPRRITVKTK